MTQPIRLTKAQQRRFYLEAVLETLITIYGKTELDSKALVSAWWKRISNTEDFKSDLLFHAEPLHTAADIAHLKSMRLPPKTKSFTSACCVEPGIGSSKNPGNRSRHPTTSEPVSRGAKFSLLRTEHSDAVKPTDPPSKSCLPGAENLADVLRRGGPFKPRFWLEWARDPLTPFRLHPKRLQSMQEVPMRLVSLRRRKAALVAAGAGAAAVLAEHPEMVAKPGTPCPAMFGQDLLVRVEDFAEEHPHLRRPVPRPRSRRKSETRASQATGYRLPLTPTSSAARPA